MGEHSDIFSGKLSNMQHHPYSFWNFSRQATKCGRCGDTGITASKDFPDYAGWACIRHLSNYVTVTNLDVPLGCSEGGHCLNLKRITQNNNRILQNHQNNNYEIQMSVNYLKPDTRGILCAKSCTLYRSNQKLLLFLYFVFLSDFFNKAIHGLCLYNFFFSFKFIE